MVRRFLLAAALSTASLIGFVPAASAQSYGGITLSFGSGGYSQYDEDQYPAYRTYYQPQYRRYYRDDAWIAQQRYQQRERWQREQARREYWRHQRHEQQRWHDDDDDE